MLAAPASLEIINYKRIKHIKVLYLLSEQIQELFENADEPQLIDHLGNISPILSGIKDYRKVYEYVFETFFGEIF